MYNIENKIHITRESDGAVVVLTGSSANSFNNIAANIDNQDDLNSFAENYFNANVKSSKQYLEDLMHLINETAAKGGDAGLAAANFLDDLRAGKI